MKQQKNPIRPNVPVETFEIQTKDGKVYEFKVQPPDFEQLRFAMMNFVTTDGKVDLVGAGKVIWDLCVTEFDEEIEKTPGILIMACMKLAEEYLQSVEVEIKKKSSNTKSASTA